MYKDLYHVECKNARTNADKKLEKTLFREIDNENVPFFVKLNINCIAQFNVLVVNYLKKNSLGYILYSFSEKIKGFGMIN